MEHGDAPLDSSWVASVHRRRGDYEPLGAAVVIDESRVLTCSHVVAGQAELWVAFPKADPPSIEYRRVLRDVQAEPRAVGDVCVLHLDEPVPKGVRPARLRAPSPDALRDRRWWAFGFAGADPFGNSAEGVVGEALGHGRIRLDSDSRYLVERGFSGGGLWCGSYGAVVGVVGQANERGDGRALTFDWLDARLPTEKIRLLSAWAAIDAGEVGLAAWGGDCPATLRRTGTGAPGQGASPSTVSGGSGFGVVTRRCRRSSPGWGGLDPTATCWWSPAARVWASQRCWAGS